MQMLQNAFTVSHCVRLVWLCLQLALPLLATSLASSRASHPLDPLNEKDIEAVHHQRFFNFLLDINSFVRRAGFMNYHLWVTPYTRGEGYAGGYYVNQSRQ